MTPTETPIAPAAEALAERRRCEDTVHPFTEDRCEAPATQLLTREDGRAVTLDHSRAKMELCDDHARLWARVLRKYYPEVDFTLTPLTESEHNG